MMTFDVANTLTSLIFIKRIKAIYGSKIIVLTDGAPYYKASCKILNQRHGVYSSEVRNLMERIIQLRMELGYSITTYHVLRRSVMRNMQKTF
jgi:transposase-like protein